MQLGVMPPGCPPEAYAPRLAHWHDRWRPDEPAWATLRRWGGLWRHGQRSVPVPVSIADRGLDRERSIT